MTRRRKESWIDIFLNAPWWVSAVVSATGFAAFQWILPALTSSIKMHLLDGRDLLAKIEALPGTGAAELLAMATAGDYMIPSCPSCGTKMV